MLPERHARLFRTGRSQAVRIPRAFELAGDGAIMRKEGERLVIEPAPRPALLAALAEQEPIEEDFPPIGELPHTPVDLRAGLVPARHQHRLAARPSPARPRRRARRAGLLIAPHALTLGCTLVTDDGGDFARVPRLACENWLRDAPT